MLYCQKVVWGFFYCVCVITSFMLCFYVFSSFPVSVFVPWKPNINNSRNPADNLRISECVIDSLRYRPIP